MRWRRATACLWALAALAAAPRVARAWEPFRSENANVRLGNERMRAGDTAGALQAYTEAAAELPAEPGVHLNRGLALMAQGETAEARQALQLATATGRDKAVRAAAYYALGLSFLSEADAAADADQLDAAQKGLREAVDAFKSSLRNKPGDRDAAWNLELALRRLQDVDQKKREQDEQKQDEQEQDEQKQDEQKQDEQKQDEQKQDEQEQDEQEQDPQDPQQDPQEQQPRDPQEQAREPQPQDKKPQQEQEHQGPREQPQPEPQERPTEQRLPQHMQRVLDALQDSEQNLEKLRARQRAARRPRRVEKDW